MKQVLEIFQQHIHDTVSLHLLLLARLRILYSRTYWIVQDFGSGQRDKCHMLLMTMLQPIDQLGYIVCMQQRVDRFVLGTIRRYIQYIR